MKPPREYWPRWAATLRRYELHEIAASFLEAGSPLVLLGAQALYFSRGFFGYDQISALAATLEKEDETRAFAAFLTQEAAQ